MKAHQRVGGATDDHVVEGAEVLEDFQSARLDALGARALEAARSFVDDTHGHAASDQVDAKRRADGSGTDDQNLSGLRSHGRVHSVCEAMKAARCSATSAGRS